MKQVLIRSEFMAIIYLLSLPVYLYSYSQGNIFFWILLVYIDLMQWYLLDVPHILLAMKDPLYKSLFSRLRIYVMAGSAFLVIIAFKNIELAMILVINDMMVSLFNPSIRKMRKRKN